MICSILSLEEIKAMPMFKGGISLGGHQWRIQDVVVCHGHIVIIGERVRPCYAKLTSSLYIPLISTKSDLETISIR